MYRWSRRNYRRLKIIVFLSLVLCRERCASMKSVAVELSVRRVVNDIVCYRAALSDVECESGGTHAPVYLLIVLFEELSQY